MIAIQLNPECWVMLDKIESVGWDAETACPGVWTTSGCKIPATLFAGVAEGRDGKIRVLLDAIGKAYRDAMTIQMGDLDPLESLQSTALPPEPRGADVVDRTERIIDHEREGYAHSDDVKAILRCRVCTPQP